MCDSNSLLDLHHAPPPTWPVLLTNEFCHGVLPRMCLRPVPGMAPNQQASTLSHKVLDFLQMIAAVGRAHKHAQVLPEVRLHTVAPVADEVEAGRVGKRSHPDQPAAACIQPVDGIFPKLSQRLRKSKNRL